MQRGDKEAFRMDFLGRLEGRRNTKGSLWKECKCKGMREKVRVKE